MLGVKWGNELVVCVGLPRMVTVGVNLMGTCYKLQYFMMAALDSANILLNCMKPRGILLVEMLALYRHERYL